MSSHHDTRPDVRSAVLTLLTEEPMHGSRVIAELTERSGGRWSPSPGEVYPTLQLLADDGLVVAEPVGGKKLYRLTEAGATDAAARPAGPPAWAQEVEPRRGRTAYHQAAGQLLQAVFQVGTTGTSRQVATAAEILTDARRRLYALLAED